MGPQPETHGADPAAPAWVVVLDVGAKLLLLLAVAMVALDPAWGNLEGKAPGTRAVTYPLLALVVPLAHHLRRRPARYPWLADLLVTFPAFSDILGNRMDLYDRVVWFDDFMHFLATGSLSAAVVLLSGAGHASLVRRLVVALSAGMTLALAWEVWEYFAFVARSGEGVSAYSDTVGDLALGWLGAATAAVLVGVLPGRADGESARVGSGSGSAAPVGTDAVESRDLRP